MDTNLFLPSPLHFITTIFVILILFSISLCQDHEQYTECQRPYNCGAIQKISYPFWGGDRPQFCGRQGFELSCRNDEYSVINNTDGQEFRVVKMNQSGYMMTIARMDLWESYCPVSPEGLTNTTFEYALFDHGATNQNITLFYNCTRQVSPLIKYSFTCTTNGVWSDGFYADDFFLQRNDLDLTICEIGVRVPVLLAAFEELGRAKLTLDEALKQGFDVDYEADQELCSKCVGSGGICGSNQISFQFACLCRSHPYPSVCPKENDYVADGELCSKCVDSGGICGSDNTSALQFACLCRSHPYPSVCPKKADTTWILKVVTGATATGAGILLLFVIIFRSKISSMAFWRKRSKTDHQNLEAFIRNHGPLALKRYSYSSVKKMTNSFTDKLGQGGYGGVYKGQLLDGRLVAVKVLKVSKGNGEEFINEVASISKTSHVNIVSLLGFCLEARKRALIYEFMPNGSLEKFIYKDNSARASQHLGWEKLYQIAIEIARGLEYLHRGCNTRILHFDIKPHNILLDDDFCPKISDFGLAKLCTGKESIVSMLEARGTVGYIAPEVFHRNFGGVSHKSDVYSYGMMVLEMVGARNKINVGVSESSEYFPQWVYKHLEQSEEMGLHGVLTREENDVLRKMILVGLWCIQTIPSNRPSISKVIDMLEGSIEALQIPPKPILSSPSRSRLEINSATSTSSYVIQEQE